MELQRDVDNQSERNISNEADKSSVASNRWHLPLPQSQFTGWIIFYNVAYVIVVITAIVQVIFEEPVGRYPNQLLAIGAILLLLVIYGWFLMQMTRHTSWPLPLRITGTYFGLSLILICIAWLFHKNVAWLMWMYIGQMFGMLTFQVALPATIVTVGLMLLLFNDLQLERLGWGNSFGELFYWFFLMVSGFYIYQLVRASGQRGALIIELEETTRQLQLEQEKNAELAILRERERLARDMHDGLGHTMAALTVQLEAAQRLYRVDPEKASTMLDDAKQSIRESMESLRRTLTGLRSPGLGDRSLVSALHSLCNEFRENSGLQIDTAIAEFGDQLPRAVADALWRVAQESLNNVQKHAEATQVTLSLRMGAKRVILEIADNGTGMDDDFTPRPNRYGVTGMTERMEGLGGTLEIESQSDKGTTVKASVPRLG